METTIERPAQIEEAPLCEKGEEAAARYLESKGYEVIRKNWFCKFGEVDIIANDPDGALCFIDVKTRRNIEVGLPEESITRETRKRRERVALAYLMVNDNWEGDLGVRFDSICICVTGPHRALLRHHKGCFNSSF